MKIPKLQIHVNNNKKIKPYIYQKYIVWKYTKNELINSNQFLNEMIKRVEQKGTIHVSVKIKKMFTIKIWSRKLKVFYFVYVHHRHFFY